MSKYFLFVLFLIVGCEGKRTNNYKVVLKNKFNTSIPIEFSTQFSTTFKWDNSALVTNVSNKILVLNENDFSRDSIIEFPEYEVNDIGTISLNPFKNSIIGHSEKRNGFIEFADGKTTFYPLNLSDYYIVDNRKSSGHFISPSKMIVSLTKGDLSYFQKEMIDEKLTTFAVYDFNQMKVTDFFGTYPKEILDARGNYPKEFQVPFNLIYEDKLIIGYPLSDELISYNLNNFKDFQSKKVESNIFKLPAPFSDREDRYEVFKLFYYSNKYGPISYHKDLDIFSRIVIHELSVNSKDACDRKYSVILFDKNLEKLEEIEVSDIYNSDWAFALSTPTGFLLSGICENYLGEDFFIYNAYVDLIEI
ncbi:hypothetical protein [Algoriphagus litoralis]|uniref:hypothetical protein n=1 Tax=Algoriphagus litoralis TaxID=2202829 RepID=UPI000DBA0431|nr:hypothetical protein [Algoriphagus litoralis]